MHIRWIAEVGQNYIGSYLQKRPLILYLIRECAKSADWLKFQLYDARKLFTGEEEFYTDTTMAELTYSQADFVIKVLKMLEQDAEVIEARKKLGKTEPPRPLFSAFDPGRLAWAIEIITHYYPDLDCIDFKVASRVAADANLLTACKGFKNAKNQYRDNERIYRPLHGIISHGMKVFTNEDYARYFDRQSHLFCKSEYPCTYTPTDWAQFEQGLKDGVYQGISDHALGIDSVAHAIELANSAGLDTFFVEKHVTISKDFRGPDHRLSITPLELSQLVERYH